VSARSSIWHPLTQHGLSREEVFIEAAQGAWLHGRDGRRILDGISSWWVITHGHCHPKIVAAVQEQAARLDQVIFAGFTHAPAEVLAEKLLEVSDPGLEHVFFSDSGSTAVEVALKMAIGHFAQTDRPRRRIAALEGGYHGDTFGAMAAGGRSVFNRLYEPYLFEVQHLPFPEAGEEHLTLQACEDLLKKGDVAALILEPLVQGAAGMRMYGAETLRSLHGLCRTYGTLLIADEVMTGFGRTGSLFACEQAGIAPDLLCLSKGLTGGFLPMGATLATKEIYRAFYGPERGKMFFHSTSFTGNPLACAAALASLEIWNEEPVLQRMRIIAASHARASIRFKVRSDVKNVRSLGAIFALDVQDENGSYLSEIAPVLYEYFLGEDVLLRPIGNTVYILPPYCITQEELDLLYDTLWRTLDRLGNEGPKRAA
jgi:adenosylmethionine---8-amino-7-oxononanoate aminotransferase